MKERIVGIDMGSWQIYSAVGTVENDNINILGISSNNCEGIRSSSIIDTETTSKSVKDCINNLEEIIKDKIEEVYISIPTSMCEFVENEGEIIIGDRKITEDDLEKVVDSTKLFNIAKDKEIVGVVPKYFNVDQYKNIKNPVGMKASVLKVNADVVLARTLDLNNILKSINDAGVRIKGVVFEPFAASEVILHNTEKNLGAALVDVGADTTKIYVFKSGMLKYKNTVHLGGSNITKDISYCLKIPYDDAEKLKIKYSNLESNKYSNTKIKINSEIKGTFDGKLEIDYKIFNEIVEARIEEILYFIKKELIQSKYINDINSIIIVGGGISQIKNIERVCEDILQKPIKIGCPMYVGANSPMYSNCVGVIKHIINSFDDSKRVDENYEMNKEYKKEKIIKEDKPTKEFKQNKKNKEKENNKGFIDKIRKFLNDFF